MSGGSSQRARFLELVDPQLDALHRTALRLTRDAGHAEDLVQETLLRAYRGIDGFAPETNFKAWIFRILMNTFINRYRRDRSRIRETELDGLVEPEALDRPGEEAGLLDRPGATVEGVFEQVDERIRAAVLDLPESLRTVFLLAVVEGLKYREVADAVGCPVGTVMSRLFRGRAILRERLKSFAAEEGYLEDG